MTQYFEIDEKDRKKLARCHRAFQATVAERANQALGLNHPPQGIGRYQGGVTINGKLLVIHSNNVSQSWRNAADATPEEVAVANAITSVVADFKRLGRKALIKPNNNLQDPLRWFFEGPSGNSGIKLQ